MGYWSDSAKGCDFAFDAVGAVIFLVKKRLKADITTVIDKAHPEQSMIATLGVLRVIGAENPKNLSVHFGRRQFEETKSSFYEWYEKCSRRIPAKHREGVLQSAEAEFQLWEEHIFGD